MIFRPLWSQKEPSMKVPGFLFSRAFKIHFDKRLKIKNRELLQQFGLYAWIAQCAMDHEIILFISDNTDNIKRINLHKKTSTHVLVFLIVIPQNFTV